MRIIKVLFWNLNNKNLVFPIRDLIVENCPDVVAMVETRNLDIPTLLNKLRTDMMEWNAIEVSPKSDIRVLAKKEIDIVPFKEESHYSIYKIKKNDEIAILLVVVHLLSKMNKSDEGQLFCTSNVSRELVKYEQELFGTSDFKTIIVGDFNMQPYEPAMCGPMGFNATMSACQAKKITRKAAGEEVYFYYNPMWALMGANRLVQGSYYNTNDNNYHAIYWYSFDSVLLRPHFVDCFNWDYFEIIEKTEKHNFVPNTTIDKEHYSDHLPIKFEIIGG